MTIRRGWLLVLGAVAAALTVAGCGGSHPVGAASHILFVSDRTGDWALYSMNLAGGDQQRVLDDLGNIEPGGEGIGFGVPTLSPDGEKVLIPRNGITSVTLATGKSTRIPYGDDSGAVWSPDSREVVYGDNHHDNQTGVFVTNLQTGKRRQIFTSESATPVSWSPDGKWILINGYVGFRPELWILHPDGSQLRALTPYVPDGAGEWLANGRFEYVGSRSDQVRPTAKLVRLDVRSGKVSVLGEVPTPDAVSWSPDGQRFAYSAGESQQKPPAFYTMDSDGHNRHRLTPGGTGSYGQLPAWSADGKSLLVVRFGPRGVDKGAQEIWTMRANGSHARQLTQAYPDEGRNVDPLWYSGAVHTVSAAASVESPRGKGWVLRVPYAVAGVAASGTRAVVLPLGGDSFAQPTAPLLVWRPGTSPVSLVGSLCGSILSPVFLGSTLAVDCAHDFSDEHAQSVLVFNLKTRLPAESMSAYSQNFGVEFGTSLYGPVLAGGRIEFESEHWTSVHKKVNRSRLINRTLWRVDGSRRRSIRSDRSLGYLVTASPTRLAFELSDTRLAITDSTGKRLTVLNLPPAHLLRISPPPVTYLLSGHDFFRLAGSQLAAWSITTGRREWSSGVPSGALLQTADTNFFAYTTGTSIYLGARTGPGGTIIKTPGRTKGLLFAYGQPKVGAALTPAGLFYTYDVAGTRFPGRVVFVPRSQLHG